MGKLLTKHKGHSKLKDEPRNMYDNEYENQALKKGMRKTQVRYPSRFLLPNLTISIFGVICDKQWELFLFYSFLETIGVIIHLNGSYVCPYC